MAKSIETISIGIKLDGKNFPIWSKLMLVNIGSREKLDHIEGENEPPARDDPKFKEWQAADYMVFSWLIQNMEPRLVVQFAQHQTAKAMWKSLVTTFGARVDPVQVYDLEITTTRTLQGDDSLEGYWSELQKLWVDTDSRKPCPYTCCDKGPGIYQKETQTKRLYQFLAGLNDKYNGLRREILKLSDTTAEEAFGIMKQEEGRTAVWRPSARLSDPGETGIGAGFGTRFHLPPPHMQTRGPPLPYTAPPALPPRGNFTNRKGLDKSKLHCSHCGMTKHTKETCFKLVGYPEWWEDGHKANKGGAGKVKTAIGREEVDGNGGVVAPAGNQMATGAGGDGNRPGELLIAGGWWGTGSGGERGEAAAPKSSASFTRSIEGYPDGDDDWAWH
ncbi:uncharacterized protein LOC125195172 [Salvia hispanica]|uniref:uncharacterized protein LOC125195172 n=1 Tax=Salvia hispanica TaxID=49212 RepID=UPI0020091103|nr:uncharacterized protein LOC125195172 [Salvia hispanica]